MPIDGDHCFYRVVDQVNDDLLLLTLVTHDRR
jgi:hypothetical protein